MSSAGTFLLTEVRARQRQDCNRRPDGTVSVLSRAPVSASENAHCSLYQEGSFVAGLSPEELELPGGFEMTCQLYLNIL